MSRFLNMTERELRVLEEALRKYAPETLGLDRTIAKELAGEVQARGWQQEMDNAPVQTVA